MVDELVFPVDKNAENIEPSKQNKTLEDVAIKQELIAYLRKQPFEFYNASATGDWPGIEINISEREIKQIKEQSQDDKEILRLQSYLEFIHLPSLLTRTSLFDNQLAKAILGELKLRGIDPACKNEEGLSICSQRSNKDHIVLISEWDTHYGRQGLPYAMHKALYGPRLEACIKRYSEKECFELGQKWVYQFSYMRGLDGVVPGEGKTAEEVSANKEKDKNKNAKSGLEGPRGKARKTICAGWRCRSEG